MKIPIVLAVVLACAGCGQAEPDSVKSIGGAVTPVTRPAASLDGKGTDVNKRDGKTEARRVTIDDGGAQPTPVEKAETPTVEEVEPVEAAVAPRDAASGLPTGKRQHKPFVVTKPQ